ncbi:capsular biosynthesis protein [Nostoc sp. 3335mG]|nr:capsular biosynthesis protein [Nostoc sp. 3335mG]
MLSFLVMLAVSVLLDAAVRPRRRGGRRWQGMLLHGLATAALFGMILTISGNPPVAALLAVAVAALLTIVSNAKHAMLGEPLLFSDLALFAWVFRHPRFYLTALTAQQRWMIALGAPAVPILLAATFVTRLAPHGVGLVMMAMAIAGLLWLPGRWPIARVPDVEADLRDYGLLATLLLYWIRWRAIRDPEPCADGDRAAPDAPELIVIVQCESFADPAALVGATDNILPGLARARAAAWRWGGLQVSGFGAYTMRTEYGVLFGRDEEALGFRRYDPYLSASGETSYALPARLAACGFRSFFVHPHDMRFYGRDKLMPASGFDRLIGPEGFPPLPPGRRYIDDLTLGAELSRLIDAAAGPTLLYAVTMENHGPWIRDPATGSHGGIDAYLHHLRGSDAMLSSLIDRLSGAGRRAMLVFFGDHRPSIPGVTKPGGDRHTPYVVLRFAADGSVLATADGPADLTPAELHHVVLDAVLESPSADR